MADTSSWLRFLPPVLWEHEPPPPAFSLGATLRIFEKILTGIDDGVAIVHGEHEHEAILATIARLHRLYDPWHTPPEFLSWLASWVALEFPDIWDAYQRRKITSEIVDIYQQRGLKRGIEDFLDLYTIAKDRPRITVDDSAKLLFVKPEIDRMPDLTSLVSQLPLVRPNGVALAPDGSLFLPDPGRDGLDDEEVWRVFPTGSYQVGGGTFVSPRPIGSAAFNLTVPIAVAADDQTPYRVYVLEERASPFATVLWRLSSPAFTAETAIATNAQIGSNLDFVAMAFDPVSDHLLILSGPKNAAPARIFDLDVSVTPPVVVTHALAQVIKPLSLAVLSNGMLAIGDGRDQTTASPGDIVLVDRTVGPPWGETLVLGGLPPAENPLVSPTAIVEEVPGRLLVADVGLKPFDFDVAWPFVKLVARQAGLYRVDIVPAAIAPAAEPKQLVWPSGMARASDGTVYISDRGAQVPLAGARDWRAEHQEFGVVAYFVGSPPLTPAQERAAKRVLHDVRQIVNKEKPAHALWSFLYRV